MRHDDDFARFAASERVRQRERAPGLLRRLLAYAATAVLLILALMFSLMLFSLLAMAGMLAWGYVWWKMRRLPRNAEEQAQTGLVIEGEVIHDSAPPPTDEIEP